ncbi:MAG: hypothetical protein ACP5D6_10460 [Kosmotogaceae bacterium]
MIPEWKIDYRKILVTCECGQIHEFDKHDLENYINRTCGLCGRLISAGVDIMISPPESNPMTQSEYDLRKLNPYDLNDVAKITRKRG